MVVMSMYMVILIIIYAVFIFRFIFPPHTYAVTYIPTYPSIHIYPYGLVAVTRAPPVHTFS